MKIIREIKENVKYIYFKKLIKHKIQFYKESRKFKGLFIQAIFHDITKFSKDEFSGFAWKECAPKQISEELLKIIGLHNICISRERVEELYKIAVKHHYEHNKHHWQYWKGEIMPEKYVKEMICGWIIECKENNIQVKDYYYNNKHTMNLHDETKIFIEKNL